MNVYLNFLHNFGILFMFDDDGLYQQCFRITLQAHFLLNILMCALDLLNVLMMAVFLVYRFCVYIGDVGFMH